ncbi:dihydroorotase [Acuticoccus sp. M5D2P5]|uniref:dihydroorotase n=1 Tax=Acuticoccus kalidii TaxID=2910977 RepID=UPI001F1BA31C|nr:dihydroorotase [Acuticoccus kalidii]MCF3936278.1 dihydroorotase [Acuticoccus kalidii]
MSDTITLHRPDDLHLHLRDGAILEAVAAASADFARAIIMPNLVPPVTTADTIAAYRTRIEAALPKGAAFEPLMTLYLTDDTTPETIDAIDGVAIAAKLYPAHATTNSASGVNDIEALTPVLERMAERGILLLVHGEVTDHEVDIFDREAVFLERVLDPLRRRVPSLKVVLEHISSKTGIDYVKSADSGLCGTITAHHLVIDRNDLLVGGIHPYNYCLPIVKRARDREALVEAATNGDTRFFFGSDSAPHTDPKKLGPCGAAGCFTAPVSLPILAHVFEEAGALQHLDPFLSRHGAAFYGIAPAEATITLERCEPYTLPPIPTPDGPIAVFDPGFALTWRVAGA